MKRFIKFLFTVQIPGYMPDPNQPERVRRSTRITIAGLTIMVPWYMITKKIREAHEGFFDWRQVFANDAYEAEQRLMKTRSHAFYILDQMVAARFMEIADADILRTLVHNSHEAERIDTLMNAFFSDLNRQMVEAFDKNLMQRDPLGTALRDILKQADIQTAPSEADVDIQHGLSSH